MKPPLWQHCKTNVCRHNTTPNHTTCVFDHWHTIVNMSPKTTNASPPDELFCAHREEHHSRSSWTGQLGGVLKNKSGTTKILLGLELDNYDFRKRTSREQQQILKCLNFLNWTMHCFRNHTTRKQHNSWGSWTAQILRSAHAEIGNNEMIEMLRLHNYEGL